MATTRIHLTLERIRKLQPPTGQQAVYFFDDDPKHLSVRVTPAGAKSFVYAGKLNGNPFRVTIGSVDHWNLDDAREEARRLQRIVDKGTDPRELAKETAAAKAAELATKKAAALAEEQANPRVKQVVTEDSIAHYCSRPSSRGLNDRPGRRTAQFAE